MQSLKIIIGAALFALVACGSPKSGLKAGGGVPPPPPQPKPGSSEPGKEEPKRQVSKDEQKDYQAAVAFFNQNDKGGWSDSACRQSAERFQSVVRQHPESVEAQYMIGLSHHKCNQLEDAEKAYQAALRIKSNHGASLSNLGEIYYRAGKADGARKYWDSAIQANGKLIAARNNVASMELEQMRKLVPWTPEWKKLEEDARFNLSNVLGVDSENVKAYTLYGLIYMEGWQKNKNRLDLAKLLLGEAAKRNAKYAPLENAYGLMYMHRNALSEALQHFMAAVELDPKFVEARMNVGLTTLGFRKYDVAKEQFSKVLELQSKNFDAQIGLGIANRGLKDFEGAEKAYKAAMQLDPRRGESYYNLAVLFKDFRATKQDPKESIATYRQAQGYFRQFIEKGGSPDDIKEAKEQVALIDKTITSTERFLQNQANQPPPAPTPPAGNAPPAKK